MLTKAIEVYSKKAHPESHIKPCIRIDRLIVNTPYNLPQRHWALATDKRFELVEQRRPAGYYITDPRYNTNRFLTAVGKRLRWLPWIIANHLQLNLAQQKSPSISRKGLNLLVATAGLEPATPAL